MLFGTFAAVVYVSAILIQDGSVTIGQMSSYLFFMQKLIFNFEVMGWVMGNLAGLLGASDKIFELMSYQPWVNFRGGDKIEGEVKGILEVRNIEFCYPAKPTVQVLKGISFNVDLEENRVIAICGHSGCGKTSIISLI